MGATTSGRRFVAGAAAVIVAILAVSAGTVLAHAELVSSNPPNQAILATGPDEIVLTFSEAVEPIGEAIRMVDAEGAPRPLGVIDQAGGDHTIRADVPARMAEGTYVVGWQALSADSHKIRGAFTFSVGVETATQPGVIDAVFDAGAPSSSESLLLGVGRFLSFAGIGVLLGALFLAAVLVPEVIGGRRAGALLVAAALTATIGTSLMFAGQAHLLSGSYLAVGDVIETDSGRWWLARLAAVGLFAMFIPARTFLTSTIGRVEVALAALLVLGVVAAGGHAIAGDDVLVALVVTVIHLAAMSIWLGGLLLLVAGVPRRWFWWTASRFSPWALGAVVVLALTGTANAWRQLGSLDGLTDTAYGRWLVIKLLLVVVVVALALFSRRLSRSDDEPDHEPANDEAVSANDDQTGPASGEPVAVDDDEAMAGGQEAPVALRRTVMFEVAGMALILMATAGLVNSPPPPSAATTQSASAIVGERIVQVELEPAVTGGTEMHVYLSSPSGGLDQADEFTIEASLPAEDLGPLEIDVVPAGPNHVTAPDANLPVAGLWTFDVTARFGDFDQVVFTVQIPVSG